MSGVTYFHQILNKSFILGSFLSEEHNKGVKNSCLHVAFGKDRNYCTLCEEIRIASEREKVRQRGSDAESRARALRADH